MVSDKELNKAIFGICGIVVVCLLLSFCSGCGKDTVETSQGSPGRSELPAKLAHKVQPVRQLLHRPHLRQTQLPIL